MRVWHLLPVLLLPFIAACTAPTSRPVQSISRDELKDHALLFGSIWNPYAGRHYGNVVYGESVEGERIRITGDVATRASGDGTGPVMLFSQLVTPGEYRFNRSGSPRMKWLSQPVRFEAGDIVYMGQFMCVPLWSGCLWVSFDQLGRDIHYASEAAPSLPWLQTSFLESDISASMFDFQKTRVDFKAPGRVMHAVSGTVFSPEVASFHRTALETQGELIGGALYHHEDADMAAEVLVYPMNLIADRHAEQNLSPRLREVVLNRETAIALSAYFSEKSEDDHDDYRVASELCVVPGPNGIRAGRRIDAIGTGPVEGERVRYCIFSDNGWLIRFQFTWHEKMNGINAAASEETEELVREFIQSQQWPTKTRGPSS
ncbi:MAG TPA: hypothetical protein VF275_01735 [Gammaproteobacteria bacterium]